MYYRFSVPRLVFINWGWVLRMAKKRMPEENTTIEGEKIGTISHYFGQIGVAVIDLAGDLKVGDKIRIKGSTTDFEQEVNSMQIDKQPVNEAGKGESIGLKVGEKVRVGDEVYRL